MKHADKCEVYRMLCQNVSFSMIRKHFKALNIIIYNSTISRIKKEFEKDKENVPCAKKTPKKRGPPFALSNRQITNLKKDVLKDNPESLSTLAQKYKVHKTTIHRYIKRNFGLGRKKKSIVHFLTEKQEAVRYHRARGLYKFLSKNLPFIITTDEKIFHLNHCNGQNPSYYKNRRDRARILVMRRAKSFPKGLMVWGGISWNGVTKLRFIEPGVKVDASYYIENVLKPFIEDDLPILYPDKKGILQQDSAPSHTAKKTLNFLNEKKIKYIPPEMWTPNSPDNAPMDFSIWSYMLRQLNRRKVSTLSSLKRALTIIWSQIPLQIIHNVLLSWPKRCLSIHKHKGKNIEQFFR